MLRKFFLGIILLFLCLMIISCNGQSKEVNAETSTGIITSAATASAEPTARSSPSPSPQPGYIGNFKLPVAGIRPIAVMIDNEGTKSLPQGGLDMAQVIYEVIVEGGETRLMPVYWDVNPTMIGSVRSSRHYFLDYAMEHDAIYVHYGWSPMAQKDISALKINNINGVTSGGVIFWDLTKDRSNWQDSYTSMKKILGYIQKVKYRTTTDKKLVFSYTDSNIEPMAGEKAEKVLIKYSNSVNCGFEYDNGTMTYNRFRKGVPQMERVSGKQLEAMNILIQFTPNNTIKGDDKGRQEVSTTGKGNGYLITHGKAVKIKWSKKSRSAQTQYTDESGNNIIINPGQTWVEILPISAKVTIE